MDLAKVLRLALARPFGGVELHVERRRIGSQSAACISKRTFYCTIWCSHRSVNNVNNHTDRLSSFTWLILTIVQFMCFPASFQTRDVVPQFYTRTRPRPAPILLHDAGPREIIDERTHRDRVESSFA